MARETDSIAAEVAGLESRLRAVSAEVARLISGAAGREDTAMTQHLGDASGRSQQTALTLRRAAATVRQLGAED